MNVTLRPFTEPEYHRFYQGYVSDPVMDPYPFHYEEELVSRSYHYNYHVREQYAHYGIFAGEEPVGCFQLKRMDADRKTCEFGIVLQNDARKNQGFGTEAIRQGMDIARERFGMETMIGDTSSENLRMVRVFEKLGFTLTERVPEAFRLVNGLPGDRLVYEITLTERQS